MMKVMGAFVLGVVFIGIVLALPIFDGGTVRVEAGAASVPNIDEVAAQIRSSSGLALSQEYGKWPAPEGADGYMFTVGNKGDKVVVYICSEQGLCKNAMKSYVSWPELFWAVGDSGLVQVGFPRQAIVDSKMKVFTMMNKL